MKSVVLGLVALAIAAPALAQDRQGGGGAAAPMAGQAQAQPAFTPPKNDKIAPPLDASAAVVNASPRHGEWVQIKMPSGPALKSWVVYPERSDKAGVVVVIHDIFGMAPNAVTWPQAVGDQLAKEGFIAIVPDLLSGMGANGAGSEGVPNVNQAIMGLSRPDVIARLDAAMAYGKTLPSSNGKTAVVGFCWGGNQSFAYAIAQPGLSAAAVYYGTAPGGGNPFAPDLTELGKLKVPIIGLYGGSDSRVTSSVEATTAAAKQLGKSYEPHVFDGAGHGFLRNQSTEPNYKAAEQAWPLTVAFFKDKLK
jgi:carboxymethylenebutenolidase